MESPASQGSPATGKAPATYHYYLGNQPAQAGPRICLNTLRFLSFSFCFSQNEVWLYASMWLVQTIRKLKNVIFIDTHLKQYDFPFTTHHHTYAHFIHSPNLVVHYFLSSANWKSPHITVRPFSVGEVLQGYYVRNLKRIQHKSVELS